MIWIIIVVILAILVNEFVYPRRPGVVVNFNEKTNKIDMGYHIRAITLSTLYLNLAVYYFAQQ